MRVHHAQNESGKVQFIAQGLQRFRIVQWLRRRPPYLVEVEYPEEPEEPEAPVEPEDPEPVVVNRPVEPAPPQRQPPGPDRGHGFVETGVGLTAGLLPNAAPSFELGGGWTRGHLLLGARASYLPPQSVRRDEGSLAFQAWDIALRGCGVVFAGPVSIPICGVGGGGAVHGRARGFAQTQASARATAYATGSVGVDWPVAPRFAFWARVEAGGTLWRPSFEIQGIGTVHAARAWRAGGALGVRFDFL